MGTFYKEDQVIRISDYLKIPKITVSSILDSYFNSLKDKLSKGSSVKVLNICYLKNPSDSNSTYETIAYISTEIGNILGISSTTVLRVLNSFEDLLILDLKRLNEYNISGLVHIKLERNAKNEYRLRLRKSVVYMNTDITVSAHAGFKRKSEVLS